MPDDQWTHIKKGAEMPVGWVLIAVKWNAGCPPSVLRAYWDKWSKEPHWNTMCGRLSDGATVRAWHPLPELPEDML